MEIGEEGEGNQGVLACKAPLTKAPRSRSRKKRVDRAQFRRNWGIQAEDRQALGPETRAEDFTRCSSLQTRCQTCVRQGHDAAMCRAPHI